MHVHVAAGASVLLQFPLLLKVGGPTSALDFPGMLGSMAVMQPAPGRSLEIAKVIDEGIAHGV